MPSARGQYGSHTKSSRGFVVTSRAREGLPGILPLTDKGEGDVLAYALGGAMANYQVWPDKSASDGIESLYRKTTEAAKFVLDNKDLYEDLEPLAETAVLFRYFPAPQPYGHSYMGLAQALAESQVPFKVLTQGDGTYIKARVTLADLKPFKVIYALFLEDLRPDERTMLREYVMSGGTIVLFDPKLLEVPDAPLSQKQGKGRIFILPQGKEGGREGAGLRRPLFRDL